MKYARIGLIVTLALIPAVLVAASFQWRGRAAGARTELLAHARATEGVYSSDSVSSLPRPVARFFRRVLRDGQALVRTTELTQQAEFVAGSGAWHPLAAAQTFSSRPPAFVWDAAIQMAPLVPVYVLDSYSGSGMMRASLLGLYSVADDHGTPELATSELQRYLAEAVWFPTALLPLCGVRWDPIDDRSARATLVDGSTTASMDFRFNDYDEVVEMSTPARYRAVNGSYVATPWAVRCSEYAGHDEMRIPMRCEVEWRLPSGPLPYWRGVVTTIRYDYGR